MKNLAYYNDNDLVACEWLRELVGAGLLPEGNINERSITEIKGADLAGYHQCHFFAGIGGWPYALALAGWDAARPVWTGSCPCQPFSSAGKGEGEEDERHLWPAWFSLIRVCRPDTILGEQVSSRAGYRWLDGIRTDLESEGYAIGAADLPACCAGAPHIRSRLFWVAHLPEEGRTDYGPAAETAREEPALSSGRCGGAGGVANAGSIERNGWESQQRPVGASQAEREQEGADDRRGGGTGGVGDAESERQRPGANGASRYGAGGIGLAGAGSGSDACHGSATGGGGDSHHCRQPGNDVQQAAGHAADAGHGLHADFWSAYDLVACRDGKSRRVEPGTFPLAHGVPGRVGLLRGYGNAIVPQTAAKFIRAFLNAEQDIMSEPFVAGERRSW